MQPLNAEIQEPVRGLCCTSGEDAPAGSNRASILPSNQCHHSILSTSKKTVSHVTAKLLSYFNLTPEGTIGLCGPIMLVCSQADRFQSQFLHLRGQWRILWRYLSGLVSPPLLSPELFLTGLSEVPLGPWLSVSTAVAPVALSVVPTEVCRCVSGLLCASESLSFPGSFLWLPVELSPILDDRKSSF